MEWHGLKIYYFLAGLFAVLAYAFIAKGWRGIGSGFLYLAVYWFGCGVDDGRSECCEKWEANNAD